jgi:restriction system protein
MRATKTELKRLEKDARDAHIASREAEVEEQNLGLAEVYDAIDSLLAATLDVDDFVDLETLRVVVAHPPFERADLETPIPKPDPIPDPPRPRLLVPDPPKGLARLIGMKKYHAAVQSAQGTYDSEMSEWQGQIARNADKQREAAVWHSEAEVARSAELEAARAKHAEVCAAQEVQAVDANRRLEELIANLGYGTPDAVQEYVSIVLANSAYPDHFPVTHEFTFDPTTAELTLRVKAPSPDKIPTIKEYRYTKATDTIGSVALSQKACRDRYSDAVNQVALRSIHEVFEADRRKLIQTIALELGTDTIDPATGLMAYFPFVSVGVDRESFMRLDLSAVVPLQTLERLGASVSKNPFGLIPAVIAGVRRL